MASAAQPGVLGLGVNHSPIQVSDRGRGWPGARGRAAGGGAGFLGRPAQAQRGGRAALRAPRGHRRSAGLREERRGRHGRQPVRAARPPTRPGPAPRTPSQARGPGLAPPLSPSPGLPCCPPRLAVQAPLPGPVVPSLPRELRVRSPVSPRLAAGGKRPGISAV